MIRAVVTLVAVACVAYACQAVFRVLHNLHDTHSLDRYEADIAAYLYQDREIVGQALKLCRLAYAPLNQDEAVTCERHVHGADGTYARCGIFKGRPFVSFAGTHDVRNLRTNVLMTQVPWDDGPGKVHAGFDAAYASVRQEIRDWCEALRETVEQPVAEHVADPEEEQAVDTEEKLVAEPKEEQVATPVEQSVVRNEMPALLVTGHSMGSALAQICALDLARQGREVINVTFAAPRVGDEAWAQGFDTAVPRAMHLHVPSDPISHIPLVSQGYRHTRRHLVLARPCTRLRA